MFKLFIKDGLMGIEAWHIKHYENAVEKFLNIAKKFNLTAAVVSDCHEHLIIHKIGVPYFSYGKSKKK
jgi:hypothetical protein